MEVDSGAVAGKRRRDSIGRGDSSQTGASSVESSQHCATQPNNKKKKGGKDDTSCTVCCDETSENDKLSCAICQMIYHAGCCGWGFTPSPTEVKLLSLTGWVCAVCCEGAKAAFNRLQAYQTTTSRRLLELNARLEIVEQNSRNGTTVRKSNTSGVEAAENKSQADVGGESGEGGRREGG